MCRIVLISFAFVAYIAYVAASPAPEVCAGCPVEQNANDPEHLKTLNSALAKSGVNSEVDKIISYKTQVVAGTKHIVEYLTKSGQKCTSTWVIQIWLSDKPQGFINNCN